MTPIFGWIDDAYHLIEFKDHPNPVPSIQLQVWATAPCGASLGYIPLLGAISEPTCQDCLKVWNAKKSPKDWSPRKDGWLPR